MCIRDRAAPCVRQRLCDHRPAPGKKPDQTAHRHVAAVHAFESAASPPQRVSAAHTPLSPCIAWSVAHIFLKAARRAAFFIAPQLKGGFSMAQTIEISGPVYPGPVSYTHLDVYKRQPLNSVNRRLPSPKAVGANCANRRSSPTSTK